MTNNIAFNMIDGKLLIMNPFRLLYSLKYQPEHVVMHQFQVALELKSRKHLNETVLQACLKKDISSLMQDQTPTYLTALEKTLRTLNKQGYIWTKYRFKFNANRQITDLQIDELSIQEKGLLTLEMLGKQQLVDYKAVIESFVSSAKQAVVDLNPVTLDKEVLIKTFEGIHDALTPVAIFDFRYHRQLDVHFDHYAGKITIHNHETFKRMIDEKNNFELEGLMKMFIERSITTMTEAKIILNALKTDTFESVFFFMSEDQVINHLSYLVDTNHVKLDFTFDETFSAKLKHIEIKDAIILDKGERYLRSAALIKMKLQGNMAKQLAMNLKQFVKEKEKQKAVKENTLLKDVIASEHLH